MKTMTVFEAKNHFSRTLRIAARDVVVVTRRGKPVLYHRKNRYGSSHSSGSSR